MKTLNLILPLAIILVVVLIGCSEKPTYYNIGHQSGVIHDPEPPKAFLPKNASQKTLAAGLRKWATVKVPIKDSTFVIDSVTYAELEQIQGKLTKWGVNTDWQVYLDKGEYKMMQSEFIYCPVYKKYGNLKHGDGVSFCSKDKKMDDILGFGGRWVLFGNHVSTDPSRTGSKCPHDHDEG